MSTKIPTLALSWGYPIAIIYIKTFAHKLPSQALHQSVSNQWNEAVGLTFTNDGVDMFVWERGGKVYVVTGGKKD